MAEFNFYSVLLLVTILNSFKIKIGGEWIHEYDSWYYTVTDTPDTPVLNGTLNMTTSPSVASCSFFCSRSGNGTLYYNNGENRCFCNNSDAGLTVNNQTEDTSSEITYGSITSTVRASHNHLIRKFDIQPYKVNCFDLYHHGYTVNAIYVIQPLEGGDLTERFCDMNNVLDVGAADCLQWLQHGYTQDGVYKICLTNGTTVDVWCDQEGGGWTVIQRRRDGSVDFYRSWTDYVNGFGDISNEYWLGLEAIHLLTKQPSALRIEMEAFENAHPISANALYDEFALQPSSDEYRLYVGNFSGDCGDGLSNQKNQKFSTRDNDNDPHIPDNCAIMYKGAWWYNKCHKSNLNGEYHDEFENIDFGEGITWYPCWGNFYSMKKCSMKVKRNL